MIFFYKGLINSERTGTESRKQYNHTFRVILRFLQELLVKFVHTPKSTIQNWKKMYFIWCFV